MNIEELEKILAEHPWLPKPRYVLLVKERVVGIVNESTLVVFKGATPITSRDRMALTIDADDITVVHELLHVIGFGEIGAYVLSPLIRMFRGVVPPIIKKEVKYQKIAQPHPMVEVYERIKY